MEPNDLTARGLRVRALVWDGSAEDCYMSATALNGFYEIGVAYGDEWYLDFTSNDDGKLVRLSDNQDGPVVPQAVAQKHHEARILAAIEVEAALLASPAVQALIAEAEARGRVEAYGKAVVAVQIVISRNTPDNGGDADPCLIDQLEAVESLIKRTASADERAAAATLRTEGTKP